MSLGTVPKDIKKIVKVLSNNLNKFQTIAANKAGGLGRTRIFTKGIATDGSAIGTYKRSTKIFRNKAGRRIDRVDLQLTGTLFESHQTGVSGKDVVLGIVSQQEPKVSIKGGVLRTQGDSGQTTDEIASEQEQRFKKEIFKPSKREIKAAEKDFIKEMNKVIAKIV